MVVTLQLPDLRMIRPCPSSDRGEFPAGEDSGENTCATQASCLADADENAVLHDQVLTLQREKKDLEDRLSTQIFSIRCFSGKDSMVRLYTFFLPLRYLLHVLASWSHLHARCGHGREGEQSLLVTK